MLAWEEGYKIGHQMMDSQHLVLFALLNQLDINIHHDMPEEAVTDVLSALEIYILRHFAEEEALMREWAFPDLGPHIVTHHFFVAEMNRLRIPGPDGDVLRAALKVRGFVMEWLLSHILAEDMAYVKFMADQERRIKAEA